MLPTNPPSAQQQHYVQANGLKMYYEEYGSGEPLILLHGGTVTSSMWQPHIPSFAQHFRVITPDSRGHGRTHNPTDELSYRVMADDVVDFIQTLGLSKPCICGYSDGGQIALEIGMRYPKLTRALAIGAAWSTITETYLSNLKAFGIEAPGAVDLEQAQRTAPDLVELWKTEHVRPDDPDYWQTLLKHLSTPWLTPLNYTTEDFQRIAVPTLIFVGDRDEMIPIEQALALYHDISNAELAILPNATHMTAVMNAELLTSIVLDFLLRHTAPPQA